MDDTQIITRARENGWCTHPMFDAQGNEVAYVAQKGPEIHFKVRDGHEHKVLILRRRIQAFARERMADFGYLTTRVPLGDAVNRRFVERCGFARTWGDTHFDYFMLTALPFERS